MNRIYCMLLLTVLCQSILAQSPKEQLTLINSGKLDTTGFYTQITYENRFGYLIIPVKIGDDRYEYIFDTGGYNTLTTDIMQKNDLPKLMEVEVGSSNKIKSRIALTRIPTVDIGGVKFNHVGAFNFDFKEAPQISCYTNGGLIGKSVIKNAVWQIDSRTNTMIITDQLSKLKHMENAIRFPVEFDKTLNPFLKASLNDKLLSFLIDFGFGGFISLTDTDGKKYLSSPREITGEGAVGANGLLWENTYVGQLKKFEIGKFRVENELAHYAGSNNLNLIGSRLSEHFIVTLNFPERELYLTPLPETPSDNNLSHGFSLNRDDKGAYVSKLYTGSPASQAGLLLKDRVSSIDHQDVNAMSYCDFYNFTQRLLNGKEPIHLIVERDSGSSNFTITKSSILD